MCRCAPCRPACTRPRCRSWCPRRCVARGSGRLAAARSCRTGSRPRPAPAPGSRGRSRYRVGPRRCGVALQVTADHLVQCGDSRDSFGRPGLGQPSGRVHELDVVAVFCPIASDEQHSFSRLASRAGRRSVWESRHHPNDQGRTPSAGTTSHHRSTLRLPTRHGLSGPRRSGGVSAHPPPATEQSPPHSRLVDLIRGLRARNRSRRGRRGSVRAFPRRAEHQGPSRSERAGLLLRTVLTQGQAGGRPQLLPLLDRIRVARLVQVRPEW